ncbi:Ig-like domain-containing protein, partial [Myxococcota bacterium]|nr:Ig-like domain-containing protein [Myxococcota bacterium]
EPPPVVLRSLRVEPEPVELVVGGVALVRAVGVYSDGHEEDVTAAARFRSENPLVAAIGNLRQNEREVVALGEGQTEISATLQGVTSPRVAVVVTATQVLEIQLDPPQALIGAGGEQRFTARALFNDGTTADVTELAAWQTSNPIVATVSNEAGRRGLVSGRAAGVTVVTALFGDVVSTPARVEVSLAVLRELAVSTPVASVPVGESVRFTATGTYSDGSQRDLTAQVVFASSDPTIAEVVPAPAEAGTLRGLRPGVSRITAAFDGQTSPGVDLTVTDARLLQIAISGDAAAIPQGTQTQFHAHGTYSDGARREVTEQVQWRSTNVLVATIASGPGIGGTALGVGAGDTRISATLAGVTSDELPLTVNAVVLTGIVVEPETLDLDVGGAGNLRATGAFSDGSTQDVTEQAVWQSVNALVASVSNEPGRRGTVTALGAGETRVSATLEDFADVATVTIRAAALERIELAPLDISLAQGQSHQFTATAIYADGTRRDVTLQATWDSSEPDVAVASDAPATRGLVTGMTVGRAFVTATLDGVESEPSEVFVTPAVLVGVAITEPAPRVMLGQTLQLTALGTFSDATTEDVTDRATWTSSNPAAATVSDRVDSKGLATGVAIGETQVRAAVDGELSPAVTLTVLPVPNQAPSVRLSCPEIGRVGEPLDFSGQGSADPDGLIAAYIFTFGDGRPAIDNFIEPDISYTYNNPGAYAVDLTVEDDDGARATARCNVTVVSSDAPNVRFVRPQGVRLTTHGERIDVLVDARPGAGRSINAVELIVDGDSVAADDSAPFEFAYTVPMEQANNSTIRLVARATDNTNEFGVALPVLLDVRNAAPTATFVAIPTGINVVDMDAAGVSDDTTPAGALEVRWDFENDGVFDTPWSVMKRTSHQYPAEGEYTIRLEVRDNIGLVSSATRQVSFADERLVSGDVLNDVWFGRVIITGDIRVPANNTLTIAEGTQIFVVKTDQDRNGLGDYGILVQGRLLVQGTANNPVVFTTYTALPSDARAAGDWDGIILQGAGTSVISHAVIENVTTGVTIRDASDVDNTTVRECTSNGISIISGANSSLTDVTVTGCADGVNVSNSNPVTIAGLTSRLNRNDGLDATGSSLNVSRSTLSENRERGFGADTTTGTLANTTVASNTTQGLDVVDGGLAVTNLYARANGDVGALFRGGAGGSLRQSLVTENAREGVSVRYHLTRSPTVTINRNNIFGNSRTGGYRYQLVDTAASLTASSNTSGIENSAGPFNAPAGGLILQAEARYTAGDVGQGRLTDGPGGVNLRTYNATTTDNIIFNRAGLTSLRVYARRDACCGTHTMTVSRVFLRGPQIAGVQLSVAGANPINARENYLGVYPNVLEAVAFSTPGNVDIQGFVGVPFDDTWTTGPYWAGALAADTTWSGTIYVSGDVTVPANRTLTIEPGTQILFAPVDQDANGVGDYLIDTTGTLMVNGAQNNAVVMAPDDPAPARGDWERLRIRNAASRVHYLTAAWADVGLQLDANAVIDHTTVRDTRSQGVHVTAGAPTFQYMRVERSGTEGFTLNSGATIEDSIITENNGSGVYCNVANCVVRYSDVSVNRQHGAVFEGAATGTLDHSVFTFNGGAGVWLFSRATNHPTLTLSNSNLFGNADTDGAILASVGTTVAGTPASASSNTSGIENQSANVAIPAGFDAFQASISYTAGDVGQGRLINAGNNANLATYNATISTWLNFDNQAGITSMKVAARRDACCGTHTMTLNELRGWRRGVRQVELSVAEYSARARPIDARNNYWGQFPVVLGDRIREARANSVNFDGFVNRAFADVGPR